MLRREFIGLVGGAAAASWPLVARAQPTSGLRRLGVLIPVAADNPSAQAYLAAFLQRLAQLGWADGGNVRIDLRWGGANLEDIGTYAKELVALAPDVILTGATSLKSLRQATRSIPIVFVLVVDPVGAGHVDTLSRPGGNATGFMQFEYSLAGKWLELLKEITPGVKRAAVLRDAAQPAGPGQFAVMQAAAPSMGIEVSAINVDDAAEIERRLAAFARGPDGGLIVTASALSVVHLDLIVELAARYKLPAIYFERYFATGGGLISFGADFADQYRQAAGYVDRILRGEKPADLPVQAPTKYQMVVNLKTAKALGLTVPPSVLARADEVIE
jgi:putative ABC transport system substrate-binding protein